MKKRIVVFLATLMCISLCACGGSDTTSGNDTNEQTGSQGKEHTIVVDTPTETEETIDDTFVIYTEIGSIPFEDENKQVCAVTITFEFQGKEEWQTINFEGKPNEYKVGDKIKLVLGSRMYEGEALPDRSNIISIEIITEEEIPNK